MSEPSLRLVPAGPAGRVRLVRPRLGALLLEDGSVRQDRLLLALNAQLRQRAHVGEILVGEGWADPADITSALARQYDLECVDLEQQPPSPDLVRSRDWRFWLGHMAVPWRKVGPVLMVATARPQRFAALARALDGEAPRILPVLATEPAIAAAIARRFRLPQSAAASTRVEARFSCRTWTARKRWPYVILGFCLLVAAAAFPGPGLRLGLFLAALSLALFVGLRVAGIVGHLAAPPAARPGRQALAARPGRLPKVSVLVPMFREREIADALVERLKRLTYPKPLLDIVLVLEERDDITRGALARAVLPTWIRVIEVPEHDGLTTKPRAMNYALDFCRGEIVGVWDAEDAPAADQIEQVVARFADADPDVVCLQGILDYYNARANWRTRCFAIEYASWFRIVLKGIARMGLVVPLGGTTLFFRRDKLEELGGWDAHNVTEDADLGVRLARAGYRTELIDTVTHEEATCRAWPWVRQRSRWLKGFMVTYLVHMRSPGQLWRDLGPARFLGFQAFFLGTLGQFLLAPLLWTFWPMAFGLDHPLQHAAGSGMIRSLLVLMLAAELLGLAIAVAAVSGANRRFLIPWILTMPLYFPLGVVAAYKAAFELAFRPFFWDKTRHGASGPDPQPPNDGPDGPHPASAGS